MFKDKNFGLPQSLIDDVSKILEETRTNSMKTPSAIGEKVAANIPARQEQHKKEMGEKVGRFAEPRLPYKLEGRLPKKKNPLAIGGVTESVKFAKFTKYLDENYHVEQLTEEEIQWIYLNELAPKDIKGHAYNPKTPRVPEKPYVPTPGSAGSTAAETEYAVVPTETGRPKPTPLSGAKLGSVTPSSDPDEGMEDAPTSKPTASKPASKPAPKPAASAPAPRPVEKQADDWKSKVHSGGLGTVEGDGSGPTMPSRVSRRTSRPSRPSGGNGGDWRKSVFEPDSGA